MKIAYLASGAAGMFCGTCLHDNTLAAALLAMGQEVLLVPTYTPLRTDEEDVSQSRVFFGGINVYLQDKSSLFRHTPWCLDSLLDAPGLINWATKHSVSIDPAQLGGLTVSMMQGEEGNLRKEMLKLVRWLETDVRPDIVHLSNALLLAFAGEIRRRLNVPVVCSLSGEDVFLERIPEPHYSQIRKLMVDRAAHVTAFTSLNRYYADFMIDYVGISPERVQVIRHGLKLDGHGRRPARQDGEPLTIGFFARICHDKGLHQLVDAFKLLCDDADLPPLKLVAGGYLAAADKHYLADLQAKLRAWNLADRFEYVGEPDRAGKIALLQSFDLMCVPTVYRESKGLSILEAMANHVPVVLPAHGAFPELVDDTGGGLLFEPGNVAALAEAIKRLVLNPELAAELGESGGQAVRNRYHDRAMAEATLALYRELTAGGSIERSVAAEPEGANAK